MQDEDEATTNNHRNSLILCRTFPPLDLSIFSMVPRLGGAKCEVGGLNP